VPKIEFPILSHPLGMLTNGMYEVSSVPDIFNEIDQSRKYQSAVRQQGWLVFSEEIV
jgi:hypothetical protein